MALRALELPRAWAVVWAQTVLLQKALLQMEHAWADGRVRVAGLDPRGSEVGMQETRSNMHPVHA